MKITLYKNISKYLSRNLINSNTYYWSKYENTNIDLILDGGAFSGSYLLGGLLYLSYLPNSLHINRISATSVGSLFAVLYLSNLLYKYNHKFYKKIRKCFKKKGNLSIIKTLLLFVKKHIGSDFYIQCNDKLYITYFDIISKKQVVRHRYYSNDDLIQSVYRSCFIPIILDGNICENNKYIDGIVPYIFPKRYDTQTIFMDLHSNYLFKMFNIKNETNNHSRILSGILETHNFFMYGMSNLCFNIYDHKYYYKTVFFIRHYIAVKFITLFNSLRNLNIKSHHKSDKLYSFIVCYIIDHLSNIYPFIIKFFINTYLV